MQYNQFCPIAKTAEILGEKWTILILRELLLGGRRFNELQRGLSFISPTLLSSRLDKLAGLGLILKKKISGQKGYEYFTTKSCRELLPIFMQMGEWGMRWTYSRLSDHEYDMELLVLYLERSIIVDQLPSGRTTVKFKFIDLNENAHWWIVIDDEKKELCVKDPGHDVDVYITTDVKTMVDVWMGSESYRGAEQKGKMSIVGESFFTRKVNAWLKDSEFKGLPAASEI